MPSRLLHEAGGYVLQAAGGDRILLFLDPVPAGRSSKRRRVQIGDTIYDVPERDVQALIEAALLRREPPRSAEPVTEPKAVRKRVKPPRTPDEAVRVADTLRSQIRVVGAADGFSALALLDRVVARLVAEMQDEEEAIIALLT